MDTWNGYHSVPLGASDCHVTTFITPCGQMKYLVAPQGFISSEDGFIYLYDLLIRHMLKIKKCIDYRQCHRVGSTLEQLFYDTTHFLSHTNSHGLTQNPPKKLWGWQDITYMGFPILKDGVQPTDKHYLPSEISLDHTP